MTPKTIFFDLDGVLADFVLGAMRLHGKSIPYTEVRWRFDLQLGIPEDDFWRPMGREFWANLPRMEDGFSLLAIAEDAVGEDNIGLLTSPCETEGCTEGKRDWVKANLPHGYLKRLFVGSAKHLFASCDKLLVDDYMENTGKFDRHGGYSFLMPRPWNSQSEKYGNPHAIHEDFAEALR